MGQRKAYRPYREGTHPFPDFHRPSRFQGKPSGTGGRTGVLVGIGVSGFMFLVSRSANNTLAAFLGFHVSGFMFLVVKQVQI
jgi:hypothetical protein